MNKMESIRQKVPLPLEFTQTFNTLKWSQKCEAIESLTKQFTSLPITQYEYDAKMLYEFISRGFKDSNLKVISAFFGLLITIIPQLPYDSDFKFEVIASLPLMVDKLKEKKDKLSSEIMQILTLLLKNESFDINDLFVSLRNFPSEKSVGYKQALSEFFFVNLRKTYKDVLAKCLSVAIEVFRALANESNCEIRNCAISSLALLKKRLQSAFDDNEETMKISDKTLLDEIREVSVNINYDAKFDLNADEEEIEVEYEEEIEEEEEDIVKKDNEEKAKKEISIIIKDKEEDDKIKGSPMKQISNPIEIKENSPLKEKKIEKVINDPFIELHPPKSDKKDISSSIKERNESPTKIANKNDSLQSSSKTPNKTHNTSSITNNTSSISESLIKRESLTITKKKSIKKDLNPPVLVKKEPMLNDIDLIPLPGTAQLLTNENEKDGDTSKDIDEFQRKIDEALRKEEEKMNSNEQSQSTAIQLKKPKKKNEEDEEFSQKAEALLDKATINLIESPKWDEKKQGLTQLNDYIKSTTLKAADRDTLFIYIKNRINNFKETNFNILREAYTCLTSLQIDKKFVPIVLNGTFEKIADPKLKEAITALLIMLLDTIGVESILSQLLSLIEKSSKMQVVKEYAAFIEKAIEDYGHDKVPIKEVVVLCKTMAANTNPQVRTSATSLLCALYKFIGNDIKVLIKDIKESTLKMIEAEFEKIQVIDPKTIKAKKGNQTEATAPQLKQELVPRADISKKLTQKLLNDINNAKWQEKKEAIEAIEKILQESNMKIVNNGLDPLFSTIKAKLCDGNKNLVRLIVQLLTKLIQAINNGFKQHTKTVALSLIANLADKMQLLRDDCQACIEEWIKAVGFEAFILFTPSFLKQDNFDMRNELLKIMTKHSDKFHKSFAEGVFKELIPSFLMCLQDKNVTVRNQVEDLIKFSLKYTSVKNYYKAISEFKPAIAVTLKAIIERVSNEIGIIDVQQWKTEEKAPPKDKTPLKEKPKQGEIKKLIPKKMALNTSIEIPKTPSKKTSKQSVNTAEPRNDKKKPTVNIVPKRLVMARSPVPVKDPLASCSVILNNKTTQLLEHKKPIEKRGIYLPQYKVKANAKEKRNEIDKKNKFNLEGGIYDYAKSLKDQFKYIFTSEFINELFNEDISKAISAIGQVIKSLEEEETKIKTIDNMDLLLKQLGWKLSSNKNPSLHKKVFELCAILLKVYADPNIHFNDTEVNVLLNVFTDKMGSTNAGIRETAKSLLNKLINVITPQKSFSLLIGLMEYKPNMKIKIEIVEICNTLYASGEIDNFQNAKVAKAVLKAYSGGDYAFKNKLFALVREVHCAIGDDIWKYVEMSEKDKDALYDKLETYNEEPDEENEEIDDDTRLSDNAGDVQPLATDIGKQQCDTEVNRALYEEDKDHPCTEEELKRVLSSLNDTSNNDTVKSMIELHDIIYKNYSLNEKLLNKSIDSIISTFVSLLANVFQSVQPEDLTVKYSKYIVTVLGKLVSLKSLISKVSPIQLGALIKIILSSLLIEKLAELGKNNEGVILLRGLNSIMLRLIENCHSTEVVLILLGVIREYRSDEANGKMCELGVKCLLRISQDKDSIYPHLALEKILRSIHELLIDFEKTCPDLQIKTKIDQIIINYLKNFIKDLVTVKKEAIIDDYIKGVEPCEIKDKYIKRWIKAALEVVSKEKESSSFITKASNDSAVKEKINPPKSARSSIDAMEENKMKLELLEAKKPLAAQQNEKLNQLKQKLISLNPKGTSSTTIHNAAHNYQSNRDSTSKIATTEQSNYKANYKSFNQIQKKWNEVNKRAQELATTKFDSKPSNKK